MSSWTPSIVPNGDDQTVYLVLDDFGRLGRSWRETDVDDTDLETVIGDLLSGQYQNPVQVVAFNTTERWSQDVSEDIADEVARRIAIDGLDIPVSLEGFLDRHCGDGPVQLPLPLTGAA